MSMDAGGLAQMTYQSPFHNTIGVSGPGFASRGKGTHIKRLSVAPPSNISTIDETQQANISSTPRTSRGHLLAGLRTAPKSATVASTNAGFGLESSKYAAPQYNSRIPQTATGAFFPNVGRNTNPNFNQQMYSLPEHVLAPPTIDIKVEDAAHMDQKIYDELVATNAYLAQQQRALQQQLLNVTAAAQQFSGMNLNTSMMDNGQAYQSPVTSPMSLYNQQYSQGLQPVVSAVPNSPGVFAVYNPMTGQSSFIFDNNLPTQESPAESAWSPTASRSRSPPKPSPSPPQDVGSLPSPSANAFRRGHNKSLSSANNVKTPGQGRTGEHPTRQPRGPPLLQELEEKPTSKHEGSKNFAIRQRRLAVHDLVRAGFVRGGF